ncbi:MAG TPA: alkaline phosphatase, partial [Longimicrobiaceae bacterium]|nr:alkaline phosphatase [Longimicrobiaceae bacterium]
ADHETGGLSITAQDGQLVARYTTTGHTGEMVPLFAYGPGAERFAGIKENYEVGRLLMEIVRARR